jgi:hypothetical protein
MPGGEKVTPEWYDAVAQCAAQAKGLEREGSRGGIRVARFRNPRRQPPSTVSQATRQRRPRDGVGARTTRYAAGPLCDRRRSGWGGRPEHHTRVWRGGFSAEVRFRRQPPGRLVDVERAVVTMETTWLEMWEERGRPDGGLFSWRPHRSCPAAVPTVRYMRCCTTGSVNKMPRQGELHAAMARSPTATDSRPSAGAVIGR